MKKYSLLLLALSITLPSFGETSTELTGKVIGSTFSVDYNTGYQSTTVNTITNVFDNNLSTFFAAYDRSGGWAGLDLGTPHVITKVGIASRTSNPKRVELGIFEGANNPDFGDALPIKIIKTTPSDNVLTDYEVSCSRAFRYVRYIGPNDARCNVAELKFYGYEGEGDDNKLYQLTNLPVVTIHTVDATDITSKEYYLQGIASIISDDGTKILTDSLNVRGRGNGSWTFPKKPYRMKFYNSTKVLDYPAKAKSWTLINNYGDKTLMRNLIAFEVSRRFGMDYTPVGRPVDVILNGEYKGCYQLCDQVEVRKNRVTLTEMKNTDIALPELSGGYFIEIDAYADEEISKFHSAIKDIPVTIKSPDDDEIVPAQSQYIENYFNKLESAVYSYDYNNPTTGYRSLLDTESFLKHFLIGEFCGNTDTYWSVYMTKERNEDKFKTGPVWDFDLAFENDGRTYPINNLYDFIYRTNGSCATGMRSFVNQIIGSSSDELKRLWSIARLKDNLNAESLNEYVDDCVNTLQESQDLNFKRWPIMNSYVHQNPRIYGSYEGEVQNVKNYITERIKWMDNKVGVDKTTDVELSTIADGNIYATTECVNAIGFEDGSSLQLFDLTGRLISQKTIDTDKYAVSCPKGAYLIIVTNGDKSFHKKLLVP